MPRFDNKIENRTIGDAFDIVRTVGGIPSDQNVTDAYLTVQAVGASNVETAFVFQKHITTTSSPTQGVIDSETSYNVTANGVQQAGSTSLIVQPLLTTMGVGTVLQFAGGAWAVVNTKALQGATTIKVDEIDAPIANGEIAVYTTVRLRFKIKAAQSGLLTPNGLHPYDIQITSDAGDPFTIEDGTFSLRPQRTVV